MAKRQLFGNHSVQSHDKDGTGDTRRLPKRRIDFYLSRAAHTAPMDGKRAKIGASDITWNKKFGKKTFHKESKSYHILYLVNRGLEPGATFELETSFVVESKDRDFDPRVSTASWSDYKKRRKEFEPVQKNPNIDPMLKNLANEVKSANSPAATVDELCKWIAGYMKYDATIKHLPPDVATTIKLKRGHCGHYFNLLKELCKEAEIPIRGAWGLNLYDPEGINSGLYKVRPNYSNVHTWAEVFLPDVGWVEVEPAQKEGTFKLPARNIQNNRWFQNSAIWLTVGGRRVKPKLTMTDGKLVSEFNDWTLVTYEVLPPKEPKVAKKRQASSKLRTWTSANGKFEIKAKLVSIDGSDAVLSKEDGSTVRLAMSKLSSKDVAWVEKNKDK